MLNARYLRGENLMLRLDELEVYRRAMAIGEKAWKIVAKWDFFAKDSLGKQFVKAADSIAANISEGYGRYSFKENKQFVYYARGSLFETATWLRKAKNRRLVDQELFAALNEEIDTAAKLVNGYIRSIGNKDSH
jgi:four helix bundle protein